MPLTKDRIEKGKSESVTTTVTPYRKRRVIDWESVGGWTAGIGIAVVCIIILF